MSDKVLGLMLTGRKVKRNGKKNIEEEVIII